MYVSIVHRLHAPLQIESSERTLNGSVEEMAERRRVIRKCMLSDLNVNANRREVGDGTEDANVTEVQEAEVPL